MVNTDSTSNINIFGGQQMTAEDFAAISKMAVEQAEQTKNLQKIQQKALDDKVAQLKGESEAEQRARKLREARDFAQKEYDDLKIAEYEDKIKRKKDRNAQEESLQKLEDENYKREKKTTEQDKKRQDEENTAANKLKNSSLLNVLPDNIKNAKQQQDGEQKDIGEKIQRVSFHPEGIRILRTLLDPIYKSLNSFTGDMDKGLKGIIDKMGNMFSSKSGIGKMLLLLLSDLLFMSGKLSGMFKFIGESITRLYTAFEEMFVRLLKGFIDYGKAFKRFLIDEPLNLLERMGLNVRKIASDSFEFVIEKFVKLKDGIIKNLKLEEMGQGIAELFNMTIIEPINNVKNVVSEFFQNRITKPIIDFIERGKNIGKSLEMFFEPLISPFKQFANLFKGGEGEGFFSRMVASFGNVVEYSKQFVGPVQNLFKFLEPLLNVLKPIIGIIEGIARIVSVEVIAVVMGIVDAVRTFFDVFKDDKLSFIQKTVSVIAGFIGGIGSLAGDTIKAIGSILSFIPGMGGISKYINKVGDAIDTHDLGKQTAQMFRDSNNQTQDVPKDAYKQGTKYQNASPEEKKRIDAQYAAMEHKNQHFVQQGKDKSKGVWVDNDTTNLSPKVTPQNQTALKPEVKPAAPAIIAQPEPIASQQQYQPTPHDIELQNEINGNWDKVIASNEKFIDKVTQTLNAIKNSNNIQQPTTVINNSSQVSQHDDTKDYLMKPVRDTNYDKKMSWYGNSLNYRATLP